MYKFKINYYADDVVFEKGEILSISSDKYQSKQGYFFNKNFVENNPDIFEKVEYVVWFADKTTFCKVHTFIESELLIDNKNYFSTEKKARKRHCKLLAEKEGIKKGKEYPYELLVDWCNHQNDIQFELYGLDVKIGVIERFSMFHEQPCFEFNNGFIAPIKGFKKFRKSLKK